MVESAGAYGPWFEWGRSEKPKPTREQLLALSDEDLIDKDTKLYLQRFQYRKNVKNYLWDCQL